MSETPQVQPMRMNHVRLFGAGVAGWLVALIILGALQFTGVSHTVRWMWVCGVGAALGAYAMWYARHSWRAK